MSERRPTVYCSVCKMLVVMNILGNASSHWADGDTLKEKDCVGSDKPGMIYPN